MGDSLRVTASPGVDAFPWADVNDDGLLDRGEVAEARPRIREAFTSALRVTDDTGEAPACSPASVSTIGEGEGHVRVTAQCAFAPAARPRGLRLRLGALGLIPFTVQGVRLTRPMRADTAPTERPEVRTGTLAPGGSLILFPTPGDASPPAADAPATGCANLRTGAVLAIAALLVPLTLHVRRRRPR